MVNAGFDFRTVWRRSWWGESLSLRLNTEVVRQVKN